MNYKPNPLLYGANEDFFSSFRLALTLNFSVDCAVLNESVQKAMERYPYFSVCPIRDGENLFLAENKNPVPVFPDDRTVILGTEESSDHLLVFGCKGNKIFLSASHYIADGMGIMPLLKTVLFLYVSSVFGEDGIEKDEILLPGEAVSEDEYSCPFPERPFESDYPFSLKNPPENVYSLDPEAFDNGGLYSYHIHIPQKSMMAKAHPSDGSPVSFLSVMLFRALSRLDPSMELPVVGHVQHQYRSAIKAPLCRHSLVSYIPVVLKRRAAGWNIEKQNTAIRGQIILGSEKSSDFSAVNRLIKAFPEGASFSEKKEAMAQYSKNSTLNKTFGISYVGKIDWSGLDRYIEDFHAYIGEKESRNMLLIEVMTVGEDFSLTFMQSGKGRRYPDAFLEELRNCDIPADLVGEGRYFLCGTRIPE